MGTHGGELAWFVSRGGQQHGPMSQLALATIACERRLDASDLIWCTGLADWVAAGDVPGLITAQATAVSRTPPKLPAGRSVREVGAVSPMETLRPTVAARRAGSDPALQREQRTPIESFAPQPRRTLLSEALARARPASTSSVPHVSDTPATPAVAVEADDRLGRIARSLSAWTSGLSSGMAAGLNRAVAVSGERVLALKASLPDIDAGALRRAFDGFDASELVGQFADALERNDIRTLADLINDDRMNGVSVLLLDTLPFYIRWGVLMTYGEEGFRRRVVYRMRDQLRAWIGPQHEGQDIRVLLGEAFRSGSGGARLETAWGDVRSQVLGATRTQSGAGSTAAGLPAGV